MNKKIWFEATCEKFTSSFKYLKNNHSVSGKACCIHIKVSGISIRPDKIQKKRFSISFSDDPSRSLLIVKHSTRVDEGFEHTWSKSKDYMKYFCA